VQVRTNNWSIAAWLLILSLIPVYASSQSTQVSKNQAQAIVQAIEDEIYFHKYEGEFLELQTEDDRACLPVYVKPDLREGGVGKVIYKLMPHGEIIRVFQIWIDGLVLLARDPEKGFAPTRQSMQTLYLDDETLVEMKHGWQRHDYTVLFWPPPERVQQAVERQGKRHAAWEDNQVGTRANADQTEREIYNDAERAAARAARSPDKTGGAKHFYLATEGETPAERPRWARGTPVQKFGPFRDSASGHLPLGAKVYVEIHR
jgi:hypothetical protein